MGHTSQARQLAGEQLRVPPIPAVADDDDDGPVPQHPASPAPVELGKGLANSSATAEVVDGPADLGEGEVHVAAPQKTGDPGQPRGEDERLNVLTASDGVGEDQQQPRVALHRSADVAQQHDRAAPEAALAVKQPDQLAARADGVTGRAAEVDQAPGGRPQAPGATFGDPPRSLSQEAFNLFRLEPGEIVEIL